MTALSLRERAISGYKVIKRIADFLLERTKFAIKEWIVSLFLRFYKNKFFSVAPRLHRQKRRKSNIADSFPCRLSCAEPNFFAPKSCFFKAFA